MAHGACDKCGCAREECECSNRNTHIIIHATVMLVILAAAQAIALLPVAVIGLSLWFGFLVTADLAAEARRYDADVAAAETVAAQTAATASRLAARRVRAAMLRVYTAAAAAAVVVVCALHYL